MKNWMLMLGLLLGFLVAPQLVSAQVMNCQPKDCARICPAMASAAEAIPASQEEVKASSSTVKTVLVGHQTTNAAPAQPTKAATKVRPSCDARPINWCNGAEAVIPSKPVGKLAKLDEC